jgi:glycosyltransferase involved in cell wall biosynthesis
MSEILFNVVIPTYNRSALLKEAISSVLKQTHQHFKIFISDNNSRDNTKEIVESFNDKRIFYHKHLVNIKVQENWEFCLKWPSDSYVAILGDDDMMLPNHLKDAEAILQSTNASFYACNAEYFGDRQGEYPCPSWLPADKSGIIILDPENSYKYLLYGAAFNPSSVIMQRNALDNIEWGKAKDLWCADYFYWSSIAVKNGFVYNKKVGVKYRWHKSNLTHDYLSNKKNIFRSSLQYRFVLRYIANRAVKYHHFNENDFVKSVVRNLQFSQNLLSALCLKRNNKIVKTAVRELIKENSQLGKKYGLKFKLAGWRYFALIDFIQRQITGWKEPKLE